MFCRTSLRHPIPVNSIGATFAKQGGAGYTRSGPVGIYRGKYEWANEHSALGGDCSLWVRAATLQLDDGQWQCQVTASNYDVQPVGIYRGKYEWANEHSALGGDCSLWVRAATLQLDDGQWQCQVTASNYDVQDALSSPPAALAVRVPPQSPRILFNGSHVLPGQNITVPAGSRATVVCEARYGNPPAYIEWYLEKDRLTAWSQTNASEVERPRVWAARSVLEMGATRSAHGKQLACRAHHPSYPAPYYRDSYTMLDVTFVPVVSILGADASGLSSLEEGSSALSLDCKADGNPKPYVWWTKDGQIIATNGPKLILAPVIRNHSEDGYLISSTPQLQLYNVSYNQHGQYVCVAKNFIGLEERSQQSSPVTLNILGPPVGPDAVSAHGWSGGEARAQASVCAEPPPRSAAWLWGSLRLNVPSHMGRYRALEAESIDGCYRYTLAISSVSASDARVYVLHVENERGVSSHAVSLTVHETAHVAPLIAAALVIAALLVLLLCLIVRCRRKRGSVEYKTDELNSDVKVLPADAVYTPQSHASVRGSIAGVVPAPGASMAPPPGAGEREGPRYSPGALQAALASLEREAKENVYAVLDPHIQYDITINKHGEPPKYLSLSKPLTHQRTHAFDPRYFANEINNNEIKLSTFKPVYRKSDRSSKGKNVNHKKSYVCKSNNDIEYSKDPCFGIVKGTESYLKNAFTQSSRYDVNKISKDIILERNSSKYNSNNETNAFEKDLFKSDPKSFRTSNHSRKSVDKTTPVKEVRKKIEISTNEQKEFNVNVNGDTTEDYKPRPGKVKEIASKFDRNTKNYAQSLNFKKERPRPLQTYGYQAYLDHVFPDAVEI
ncbi:Poliovirus receptor-related protein 3 [Papilio machaon]|uniref:Poliovirus receptor-related protein 3 n=1 Tax=Papilio machaon TaxID=76193 RepID=A0A194QUF9_PAPMA|nr:Poliovirus receptor-related protein 3 [Papilio machaon]